MTAAVASALVPYPRMDRMNCFARGVAGKPVRDDVGKPDQVIEIDDPRFRPDEVLSASPHAFPDWRPAVFDPIDKLDQHGGVVVMPAPQRPRFRSVLFQDPAEPANQQGTGIPFDNVEPMVRCLVVGLVAFQSQSPKQLAHEMGAAVLHGDNQWALGQWTASMLIVTPFSLTFWVVAISGRFAR